MTETRAQTDRPGSEPESRSQTTGCCSGPTPSSCCAPATPQSPTAVEDRAGATEAQRGADETRELVRDRYATLAQSTCSCCGPEPAGYIDGLYGPDYLATVPDEARALAMGCGNPTAIASLQPGMVVLDLGSGGGIDAILSAQRVGPEGRVIGVDMTPAMIERAREHVAKTGLTNVEFRLGQIEALPVEDCVADVIISNCVINLSPEKHKVFAEAYRVLRPGGLLAVSDMVTLKPLPGFIAGDAAAWSSCVAGAVDKDEYLRLITEAGFAGAAVKDIAVYGAEQVAAFKEVNQELFGEEGTLSRRDLEALEDCVASVRVVAMKPSGGCC